MTRDHLPTDCRVASSVPCNILVVCVACVCECARWYVCVYLCLHAYVSLYECACLSVCIYVFVSVHVFPRVCIWTSVCIFTCVFGSDWVRAGKCVWCWQVHTIRQCAVFTMRFNLMTACVHACSCTSILRRVWEVHWSIIDVPSVVSFWCIFCQTMYLTCSSKCNKDFYKRTEFVWNCTTCW